MRLSQGLGLRPLSSLHGPLWSLTETAPPRSKNSGFDLLLLVTLVRTLSRETTKCDTACTGLPRSGPVPPPVTIPLARQKVLVLCVQLRASVCRFLAQLDRWGGDRRKAGAWLGTIKKADAAINSERGRKMRKGDPSLLVLPATRALWSGASAPSVSPRAPRRGSRLRFPRMGAASSPLDGPEGEGQVVFLHITASPKYPRLCRTQPGTGLAHRSPGQRAALWI